MSPKRKWPPFCQRTSKKHIPLARWTRGICFFALARIRERIAATRRPGGNAPLPSMGNRGIFVCFPMAARMETGSPPRPKVGVLAHQMQGVGIFARRANEGWRLQCVLTKKMPNGIFEQGSRSEPFPCLFLPTSIEKYIKV